MPPGSPPPPEGLLGGLSHGKGLVTIVLLCRRGVLSSLDPPLDPPRLFGGPPPPDPPDPLCPPHPLPGFLFGGSSSLSSSSSPGWSSWLLPLLEGLLLEAPAELVCPLVLELL